MDTRPTQLIKHGKTPFEKGCDALCNMLQECGTKDKKVIMEFLCDLAGITPSDMGIRYINKEKRIEESYRVVFKEIVHNIIDTQETKTKFVEALCDVNTRF